VSRTLPPLVALRSFESAARHLSFKDAAEELSVTPSAVSHQIHNLETYLGVRLFHRMNRALRLSGAGEAYVQKVRMAFDQIEQATRDLTSAAEADVLTLSAPPSLTATWLVPRLKAFREQFPGFDVRVKGTMDDIDYAATTSMRRSAMDTAIIRGSRSSICRPNGCWCCAARRCSRAACRSTVRATC